MTSVSVGDELVDERSLSGSAPFLAELGGSLDGEDVHTVDLETRDVLTTLVVVGDGGRTVSSRSHTVLVVCILLICALAEGHVVDLLSHAKMTGRFHSLAML